MSNDVLVEVKSSYDATGTQAADRAQVNLANTTKAVGRQTATTEKEITRARQALGGLSAAAAASQGSFGGFAMALQHVGGGLADVASKWAMRAGALAAGYSLGVVIDKWLGISDAISSAIVPAEKFSNVNDQIRAKMAQLDAASLGNVKQEFRSLTESMQKSLSAMDEINGIANGLRSKQVEAETEEIKASMPAGVQRDRAILVKTREVEAEDINTRKKQAVEKYDVVAAAMKKAKAVAEAAKIEQKNADKQVEKAKAEYALNHEANGGYTGDLIAARLRKETADKVVAEAQKQLRPLQDSEGKAFMEKTNTLRGLGFESRSSVARYQGGKAAIDLSEETEAGRAAKAEQEAREAAQGRAGGAAAAAQRRYQMEQRNALTQRQAQLQNRQSEIESALPGARVDDLRSAAAAGDKARGAASAAVASMMKALQDVTSQLEAVNDKLNNLPK